jgi:hypothetical protein
MKKVIASIALVLLLTETIVYAQDLTSTHYIIRDPAIGTSGGYQSSASFKLNSVGNLNLSGDAGVSASFKGRAGFLQYPEADSGTLVPVVVGSEIDITWNATTVAGGYTVSGYKLGVGSVSGGPYTFTSVGNVLSYSYTNQVAGDYFFVLQTLDAFGNVIATSVEVTATVQEVVTFALSANTVSFGSLTPGGPRYATPSGGSSTIASGHTLEASSNGVAGYSVFYNGSTLTSGGNIIDPATISGSTTGTPGTNQFALSLLSAGTATVPSTYDQASQNWDFNQNTPSTIATTAGPTATATLDAYYLANAAVLAPAGTYDTTVTYGITANY